MAAITWTLLNFNAKINEMIIEFKITFSKSYFILGSGVVCENKFSKAQERHFWSIFSTVGRKTDNALKVMPLGLA